MAVQTVFNGLLDPSQPNITARFVDATGFYLHAPLLSSEVEIDVFLQVYFPQIVGERVRNLPLGKLSENSLLLNQADTESVTPIPAEFVDTQYEMALLLLPSEAFTLEVVVIKPNCTVLTLCLDIADLQQDVTDIKNTIDFVELALKAIFSLLGAPTLPVLPPTQAQAEFFFFQ